MTEDVLARLKEISLDPYTYLSEWKRQNNKKIIGCAPMHLPEEMIHGAGMLPVVLWRSNEAVTLGHAHMSPFNCGLTRSFVDDLVKGKLDFLDGIVLYRLCLQLEHLPFIIKSTKPPSYLEFLNLMPPNSPSPIFKDTLIAQLRNFKKSLEEWSGVKISDRSLSNSISVYNKSRTLLRKLYELRRKGKSIQAKEVLAIVHSSMLMPKEEHNELLEKLLPQLEERKPLPDKKLKVIITGALCQTPHSAIMDLIEELGMDVIDDDIYIGSRYFANDVEIGDNPVEALADRYLQVIPPCPARGDWQTHWGDYLVDVAKRNKAKGIISLLIRFCPPHLCYYPDIKRRVAEAGIPEVLIEVEHEVVSFEQVKTRLQSFAEILGGAR